MPMSDQPSAARPTGRKSRLKTGAGAPLPDTIRDYRLTVRLRNNRLLRRIEMLGFASVNRFCITNGLPYSDVCDLLAMRRSAVRRDGGWREIVERLASILRVDPPELFNSRQLAGGLKTVTRELSEKEAAGLASSAAQVLLTDQASDPYQQLENRDLVEKLLAGLDKREQRIVRRRYGLDGEPAQTLQQIADELGISDALVNQRLHQAEAKMRRWAVVKFRVLSPQNAQYLADRARLAETRRGWRQPTSRPTPQSTAVPPNLQPNLPPIPQAEPIPEPLVSTAQMPSAARAASSVWLARCMCSRGHCIMGAIDEAIDREHAQFIVELLQKKIAKWMSWHIMEPWCSQCGLSDWRYELTCTMWRTVAEAQSVFDNPASLQRVDLAAGVSWQRFDR